MDFFIALMLAALSIVFWITGALRPHRQTWVVVLIGPCCAFLIFYFGWILFASEPSLYSGQAEVGWPTLGCMILGFWAYLARPRGGGGSQPDQGATA